MSDASSPSANGTPHRRTGKVARLPKPDRDLVNVMLHDGVPYLDICKKLAQGGHQLSPANLCHWRAGGHQDWLREQAWLEAMRARLDFATDIVQQKNGDLLDAACLRIAVVQMYNLIADFNPARLSDSIARQPGAYARILNVLCKMTENAAKLERHRLEKQKSANTPAKDPRANLSLLAGALSAARPPKPAPSP